VKDFSLPDEQEEEERLMSIAQMTSQYPEELDNAFEKIKNGPETVSKRDLTNMFKKLELADYFIEIIISELSLCSEDLNHLSIRGFFERFYLEGMQNADNAID
jgi:AAA+ superfamily predicted ATPase